MGKPVLGSEKFINTVVIIILYAALSACMYVCVFVCLLFLSKLCGADQPWVHTDKMLRSEEVKRD